MEIALNAPRMRFDDPVALQEHFHAEGWTDGMPIVPPTADAVAACLEWALLPPDHLVGVLEELPEPGRRNIFVRIWRRLFG